MVTLTTYPNNTPNTRLLYSILCSVSLYSVLYVLCTICVYHAITGAQAFSQHPNYFGNVALWSGILLMNTPALLAAGGGGAGGKARFALALCSPLFMGALFYGQASGAMLNVGDLAEKKYGAQEGYRAYVQNTPLIVPGYKHLGGVGV